MPYNTRKTRPMNNTVKQFKNKEQQKQKILKAVTDKRHFTFKEVTIRQTLDFSAETI